MPHTTHGQLIRPRHTAVTPTESTLERDMAATQRQELKGIELVTVPLEGRARFEQEAMVHLDAMYSFALKLSRSRDDAEDLVSDTVLRAFERWEQYRLGTNIRAWLFTILYHVFVSRKRRIRRPRNRRLFTVPSGTPRICAISAYRSSWRSLSTTAARYSSGRLSIAVVISASRNVS